MLASSRTQINRGLGIETDIPKPCMLSFNMSVELRAKLVAMKKKFSTRFQDIELLDDGEISISKISYCFDLLCAFSQEEDITDEQKVMIENYKFAISTALYNKLQIVPETPKEKPSPSLFWRIVEYGKMVVFFLASLAVQIFGVISEFLGISEMLLALIPIITNPILLAISVILTAVSVFVQLAGQVKTVGEEFGIKFKTDAKELFKTYYKELKQAKKINLLLRDTEVAGSFSDDERQDFTKLARKITNNIACKQAVLSEYEEPLWKKIIRWSLLVFGIVTTLAGSYFGALSILTMAAPLLIGTPVGWAIIGVVAVSSLVLFIYANYDSILNLLNPALERVKKFMDKLEKFLADPNNDYEKGVGRKAGVEERVEAVSEPKIIDSDLSQTFAPAVVPREGVGSRL